MPIPTPSPAPSPASTSGTVHAVLHGVWTGIAHTAAHSPWAVAAVGTLVLVGLALRVRIAIHSGPKDPVRRFTRGDKALLLAWAGHRCEHHTWAGRCASTERLEADHIHPHSRGGWTHVSNGQILCRAHNRAKRASIPWDRSLRTLAQRRQGYYPAGADLTIVRRAPSGRRRAAA